MFGSAKIWRTLLFLAAAVLSAVMSDCIIENGAHAGLYGQSFASHDQRSVVCTLSAGLVLVLTAALICALEKAGVVRSSPGDPDWLAQAAHHIATKLSWRALPPALVAALLVRYAMESAELLSTAGHFATGLSWLGGPLFIALAVHAACCAFALLGLATVMRSLDQAVEAFILAIVSLIMTFVTLLAKRSVLARRDRRRSVYARSQFARLLGERGPPALVAA